MDPNVEQHTGPSVWIQLGVGGSFALLIIREVLNFIKGRNSDPGAGCITKSEFRTEIEAFHRHHDNEAKLMQTVANQTIKTVDLVERIEKEASAERTRHEGDMRVLVTTMTEISTTMVVIKDELIRQR